MIEAAFRVSLIQVKPRHNFGEGCPGDLTVVVQQAAPDKEEGFMNQIRGLKTTVLIAAFVLFSTTLIPLASAHKLGRMTGGGSILCEDAVTRTEFQVHHGFELHCKPEGKPVPLPNNLEVNWGVGENFHLTTLLTAVCTDEPGIEESPPEAGFDTMVGSGTGTFNNEPGATIVFTFTDAGEPGAGVDTASFLIRDASETVVLDCAETVLEQGGNHQAHKATGNQSR